ncbi:MAG: lysozyme inhibitor LprI family protein [bacterium]|nr:lysozyme inhibitor LprI family protein [bacterium]
MKKAKRIWWIIFGIILIGSVLTLAIRSRIAKVENRDSLQTAKVLEFALTNGADSGTSAQNRQQADTLAETGVWQPEEEEEAPTIAENEMEMEETVAAPGSEPPMLSGSSSGSGEAAAAAALEAEETAKEGLSEEEGTEPPEVLDAQSEPPAILISPLTGSLAVNDGEKELPSYEEEKSRLSARIADLEKQIAGRWEKDTDETMTSKMTAANYEYSVWENEMTQTVGLLAEVLPEESYEQLLDGQSRWKKTRESEAAAAASKWQGSSRENLEYIKSCSSLTKTRCLQLVNTYLEALQKQEGKELDK